MKCVATQDIVSEQAFAHVYLPLPPAVSKRREHELELHPVFVEEPVQFVEQRDPVGRRDIGDDQDRVYACGHFSGSGWPGPPAM